MFFGLIVFDGRTNPGWNNPICPRMPDAESCRNNRADGTDSKTESQTGPVKPVMLPKAWEYRC